MTSKPTNSLELQKGPLEKDAETLFKEVRAMEEG
jgi:hypothetical protein